METKELTITIDDILTSSGFNSIYNCPLANVAKRIFEKKNIYVGLHDISIKDNDQKIAIGTIDPPFFVQDYKRILKTGKPFKTTLTLCSVKHKDFYHA